MKAASDISESDLKRLKDILAEYPFIASVYLFGSVVSGRSGPMSDVDMAVLLKDDAPGGKELLHAEDYLAYRIAKALEVAEVDLVDLNGQGLVFQHQVLKTGRLIYDADQSYRIAFTARVISDFCDFEPTLRLIEKFRMRGLMRRFAAP